MESILLTYERVPINTHQIHINVHQTTSLSSNAEHYLWITKGYAPWSYWYYQGVTNGKVDTKTIFSIIITKVITITKVTILK